MYISRRRNLIIKLLCDSVTQIYNITTLFCEFVINNVQKYLFWIHSQYQKSYFKLSFHKLVFWHKLELYRSSFFVLLQRVYKMTISVVEKIMHIISCAKKVKTNAKCRLLCAHKHAHIHNTSSTQWWLTRETKKPTSATTHKTESGCLLWK